MPDVKNRVADPEQLFGSHAVAETEQQHPYRWDGVWKFLLLNEPVRSVLFNDIKYKSAKFMFDSTVDKCRGESRFIITYLDIGGCLHIEFCAESPAWVAQHAFMQALNFAERVDTMDMSPGEGYALARTCIIDLRSILPAQYERPIDIRHGRQFEICTRFNIPVAHIGSRFPALYGITEHQSIDDARKAVRELYTQMGGSTGFGNKELLKRCAALADPEVWTVGGARSKVIDLLSSDDESPTSGVSTMNLR